MPPSRPQFAAPPRTAPFLRRSSFQEELIGLAPSDYDWGCGRDRIGRNMLGRILMEVREILADPSSKGTTSTT